MQAVEGIYFSGINQSGSSISGNTATNFNDANIFTQAGYRFETQSLEEAEPGKYATETKSYEQGVYSSFGYVCTNFPTVWKTSVSTVTETVDAIRSKGRSICDQACSSISALFGDISAILKDDSKTDKEKEKEIRFIFKKMEAIQQEAEKKMEPLGDIGKIVAQIALATMDDDGTADGSLIPLKAQIMSLISNVSTSGASFSDAKSEKDIKKMLDQSTSDLPEIKFDGNEKQQNQKAIDEKIASLRARLQSGSLNAEEIKKTQTEITTLEKTKGVWRKLPTT